MWIKAKPLIWELWEIHLNTCILTVFLNSLKRLFSKHNILNPWQILHSFCSWDEKCFLSGLITLYIPKFLVWKNDLASPTLCTRMLRRDFCYGHGTLPADSTNWLHVSNWPPENKGVKQDFPLPPRLSFLSFQFSWKEVLIARVSLWYCKLTSF